MSKVLALGLLLISQIAFADCITMDSAKKLLHKHLETKGEAEFPSFFEGKSISQKLQVVEELVAKTVVVTYEDYDDLDKIVAYSIEMDGGNDRWGRYHQSYLFAHCDGTIEKVDVAQD